MADHEVPEERLSLGQAAELLGVSARTVDRWARRGLIAFVVVDGKRRFPRAALERLVDGDKEPPRSAR